MKSKIIYGIMGGVILLVIGAVFGWITGADIGGNFFTQFQLGGLRGYEAVGKIGALLGAAIGLVFGVFLGVKLAAR